MLTQRIAELKTRMMRAAKSRGRSLNDITIVAVTKTVDHQLAKEAFEAGIMDFGENRVHELRDKQERLPDARWHMIGRMQTNKVKDLIDEKSQPFLIHSLDRWNLAKELNKRGQVLGVAIPVLLQVNVANETQKTGVSPGEAADFLSSLNEFDYLRVWGLMTMAPIIEKQEEARPVFRELSLLRERLNQRKFPNTELKYLSMGMSQDFEVAIEEGSDMIRVGSALFQ